MIYQINALAFNMKILLAEYAVGIGLDGTLLKEGGAMLKTLVDSFSRIGHEVTYLSSGPVLQNGKAVSSCEENFKAVLETEALCADAGLVIGPDELLANLSAIVENNTINLGCSSVSAGLCADKLECTRMLQSNSISVPRIIENGTEGICVIKPRFGCASEGVRMAVSSNVQEGYIATEYIEGEHLSVSMICGKRSLPLSVNKQHIEIDCSKPDSPVVYRGNIVPFRTEQDQELFDVAVKTGKVLGCNGYIGVDIVYGKEPYVVDVNPRPTTAIYGLARTLRTEIGELLLKNVLGELPDAVSTEGEFSFTKDDFEDIV
jgi:predicted ATP-grasp superfamily ATP-dependent carboligase